MSSRREMAIKRRRRFIITVATAFLLVICITAFAVSCSLKDTKKQKTDKTESKISKTVETDSSEPEKIIDSEPEKIIDSEPDELNGLNAEYSVMMLVNGNNPLPDGYDAGVRKDLVEIDANLRNNNYVTKIRHDVYPYITAMVKAAQADGVNLKVWSPFRSYADQKALFDKQVARCGGDEAKAATVVARPGTSEHNTGICADFNMADDAFENTPMYTWMCENAEDYGFILRYPKDKQDITGVIYESWHWRFVGINRAKAINKSGLCLEEYIEKYGDNKF